MSTIFDKILLDIENSRKEIYGEYTQEEKDIVANWNLMLMDEEILKLTAFADEEFLRRFLETIPLSEQFIYVKNTCDYMLNKECNHEYVIVTRRSVPSPIPKPEVFWSTEHRVVLNGLKNELPEGSPVRLHSAIMVSTLGRLESHGTSCTNGGASDGEIVINPYKSFCDFLFIYKPERELKLLNEYLNNGGITQSELLEELKANAIERMERQGLINSEGNAL